MSNEHDYPEEPQSRGEEYLQYICAQLEKGGEEHDYPEEPQSRGEKYLQYICERLEEGVCLAPGEGGGGLTQAQLRQLNAATAGVNALNSEIVKKSSKVRIDYHGGNVFKMGETPLNFADIYNYHMVKPDFTFIVYGNRAYLCSFVNYPTTGMKEMRFESVINSDSRTKVSSIYITSNDGVTITNTSVMDVNSENSSNKVSAITDANKASTTNYPSTHALTEYVDPPIERTRIQIKALLEAANGSLYTTDTDDTMAYAKPVPDEALPVALLNGWGGQTVMRNQQIPTAMIELDVTVADDASTTKWGPRLGDIPAAQLEAMVDHVVLAVGEVESPYISVAWGAQAYYFVTGKPISLVTAETKRVGVHRLPRKAITSMSTGAWNGGLLIHLWPGATSGLYHVKLQLYDLTQWFGAEIADTITTPEQAYALGVPRELIDYDRGTELNAVVLGLDLGAASRPIPEAIRSLPGYGRSGSYVDVSAGTYTAPDGTVTDISALLPANIDILEVDPGGAVTFLQEGGRKIGMPSSVSYFVKTEGTGQSGGAVASVNGKVGAVVLNANDVGALPKTTTIPPDLSQDVTELKDRMDDMSMLDNEYFGYTGHLQKYEHGVGFYTPENTYNPSTSYVWFDLRLDGDVEITNAAKNGVANWLDADKNLISNFVNWAPISRVYRKQYGKYVRISVNASELQNVIVKSLESPVRNAVSAVAERKTTEAVKFRGWNRGGYKIADGEFSQLFKNYIHTVNPIKLCDVESITFEVADGYLGSVYYWQDDQYLGVKTITNNADMRQHYPDANIARVALCDRNYSIIYDVDLYASKITGTVTLNRLKTIDNLDITEPKPPKIITIHDDDGGNQFYNNILPLVRELKVPITSVNCGANTGDTAASNTGRMNWAKLEECMLSGVEVGSHTFNDIGSTAHPIVDPDTGERVMSDEDIIMDLVKNRALMSSHGANTDMLVYPNHTWETEDIEKYTQMAGHKYAFVSFSEHGGKVYKRGEIDRWFIDRFYLDDKLLDANALKAVIDTINSKCTDGTGWAVMNFHCTFGAWADEAKVPVMVANLKTMILYAISKGFKIVSSEAGANMYIFDNGLEPASMSIANGGTGTPGIDYVLTEQDKQDIANLVPAYDDSALKTALAQKYTKPASGIPASDLAAGVIPTVPPEVTEDTVRGWGFTKNTGTYIKPASGIPASDLAPGVIPSVPSKLPNPSALTFTGAVTGTYDGSNPLSIEIPEYVDFSKQQNLTDAQKIQARGNIGIHVCTQAEYDSIGDHGSDLYIIVEE